MWAARRGFQFETHDCDLYPHYHCDDTRDFRPPSVDIHWRTIAFAAIDSRFVPVHPTREEMKQQMKKQNKAEMATPRKPSDQI